jgi:hypothetical protein
VRAWLLALAAVLVLGPALVTAADPEPSPGPSLEAAADPLASGDPSATPTPTAEPAAEPTPSADPTPDPTASADPSASADPTPDPTASADPTPLPTPAPVIQTVLVYRRSAVVRQYTSYWCVPAAVQTMRNLIRGTSNRTYASQSFLYRQIRMHNRYRYRTAGNDVQGWAWALQRWAYQPYRARAYASKSEALNVIMESIDRTRHPVGVTVRAGSHAWVVLGFRAAVDPVDPTKRTLLGFYVSGPLLSPRDPHPYRYMTIDAFRQVYTRYHEWQRRVIWEGKYVVVSH